MLNTKAVPPAQTQQRAVAAPYNPPAVGAALSPKRATLSPQDAQQSNPLRKVAFYFGLGLVFVLFGVLPELIYYITGANTYLLYFFFPPAILGAFATGGLRRTLRFRASWLWIAFFAWMILATPFSYWKGGSTARIYDYGRLSMPLLFILGGLATNWKEVRAIFYTIAGAAFLTTVSARLFTHADEGGRLTLQASGTIGNSNDLAAHLLLLLPFLFYIVVDRKKLGVVRYALLLPIAYGIWVITGTASRGAIIALIAMFLFMLWRATPTQRILSLVAAVVLAATMLLFLPGSVLSRLGTLIGQEHVEAEESAESRSYLFKTSLKYTWQHPLFGVGPDQFANYEGNLSLSSGQVGNWHATHCAWTQVSAECGIPALVFFALGIGSALLLVNKTWRQAHNEGYTEIANACFCYLMAMVGFLVAITFLANAYRFYLPAMIGLAITLRVIALQQMSARPEQAKVSLPRFPAQQPLAVR
jgi:O-antigen ligase